MKKKKKPYYSRHNLPQPKTKKNMYKEKKALAWIVAIVFGLPILYQIIVYIPKAIPAAIFLVAAGYILFGKAKQY